MLVVYIMLGCVLALFVLCFFLAYGIHFKAFGKRWDPDGIIQYYKVEDYPEFKKEEITIPYKKLKLRGFLYFYDSSQSKGIVVFAHGMWGSHRAYLQEIESLARDGYRVLGFDYKGTDLSDGKSIAGLGNSLASLDYAIRHIKAIYPKDNIYVMGHSWGGFAAINIAKYHKDISGIVAMAPFLNGRRVLKTMLPKILHFLIPFILIIDSFQCGAYSLSNGIRTLKKSKIKILLLHSKDDNMIPFKTSTGYLIKHIDNPNISYKIVDGKRHNPDYSLEALNYTKKAFDALSKLNTKEEKLEFKKTMDYLKMGELDNDIIEIILQFYRSV